MKIFKEKKEWDRLSERFKVAKLYAFSYILKIGRKFYTSFIYKKIKNVKIRKSYYIAMCKMMLRFNNMERAHYIKYMNWCKKYAYIELDNGNYCEYDKYFKTYCIYKQSFWGTVELEDECKKSLERYGVMR